MLKRITPIPKRVTSMLSAVEDLPDISDITLGGVVFSSEAAYEDGEVSVGYLGNLFGVITFVEFLRPEQAEEKGVLDAFLIYCKKKYGDPDEEGVRYCGWAAENGVFFGKEPYKEGKSATMTAEEYGVALAVLNEM